MFCPLVCKQMAIVTRNKKNNIQFDWKMKKLSTYGNQAMPGGGGGGVLCWLFSQNIILVIICYYIEL